VQHKDALAASLRRLRTERGLSLAQLGRATGISGSFLSMVEQGQSDITIGRLIRLADFFEVEIPDLLGTEPRSPNADIHVMRVDPDNLLRSETEGVDRFDLSGGPRWTFLSNLSVHRPGASVEVDVGREREAMVFVLEGTFEIAFDGEEPIRLRRGEGVTYRRVARYRFTNVGSARGRVLGIVLRHEHDGPS
jgi:transcriptional regulator with XRE-family HTH domain